MMTRRTLLALVIAGVVAVLVTTMGISAGVSRASESGQHLQGAWIVNVSPTGPDAPPPFVTASAFIPDGSMVNVDPDGNGAVGEWIRVGNRQFAITFVGLFLQDDQPFSAKVRSNLTLDITEDEFSGPFQTDILDPDGNVVASFSGTVQATRIQVEPLE